MINVSTLLSSLKVDLGIVSGRYDQRLIAYLQNAAQQIEREGITINPCADSQLIIMYASWLWRRRDTGEGMPRMLRYTLNNRLFSEKAGADE